MTVELDGDSPAVLAVGDTVVLPAGRLRRLLADPTTGLSALVAGPGDARAELADGADRGLPGWIVPTPGAAESHAMAGWTTIS